MKTNLLSSIREKIKLLFLNEQNFKLFINESKMLTVDP